MLILGVETSCDETSASVIDASEELGVSLLSNATASSIQLHATTGGIIPESAARQQLIYIIPVIKRALFDAGLNFENPKIDAIGITYGPGLIGSLLIGVETVRTLSYIWNIPIIPVNHLIGHMYANWIGLNPATQMLPVISLIVSGGHTDLVLIRNHGNIKWLGGTRDDAAGEALDKIGRLLNLPYPGGPAIEKAALKGRRGEFLFPRPLIDSRDFDFSFSGLKTSVSNTVKKIDKLNARVVGDISLAVQESIVEVLVKKTMLAADKYKVSSVILSGGVASNSKLRETMENESIKLGKKFFAPPINLCTDNGAMIASAAFFNNRQIPWQKVNANPGLYF